MYIVRLSDRPATACALGSLGSETALPLLDLDGATKIDVKLRRQILGLLLGRRTSAAYPAMRSADLGDVRQPPPLPPSATGTRCIVAGDLGQTSGTNGRRPD